jgi:hypothetical protein
VVEYYARKYEINFNSENRRARALGRVEMIKRGEL